MSTFRKTIISEICWDSVVAAVVVSWQHLSTFGIVYKTSVFLNFSAENQWKKFDFCLPKIILLQIYYIPSSDMIFKVKKQPKNEAKSAHFRAVFLFVCHGENAPSLCNFLYKICNIPANNSLQIIRNVL